MPQESDSRERILDAALVLFGRRGYRGATVRAIAAEAGVSPGLVIHHWGGKLELKQACDDLVIHHLQCAEPILTGGPLPDLDAMDAAGEPLERYAMALLGEGGEAAYALFARMVGNTSEALARGEASGTVRPSRDPEVRAALLVAQAVAARTFEGMIARCLGDGDTRTTKLRLAQEGAAVATTGVFTDALADVAMTSVTAEPGTPHHDRCDQTLRKSGQPSHDGEGPVRDIGDRSGSPPVGPVGNAHAGSGPYPEESAAPVSDDQPVPPHLTKEHL